MSEKTTWLDDQQQEQTWREMLEDSIEPETDEESDQEEDCNGNGSD